VSLGHLATPIPGNESDIDLDAMVAKANQPRLLSNGVRFDGVERTGRTFVYNYTVVGLSHVPTQAPVDAAKTQSVTAICADTSSRRLFLSIGKATFQFMNDSGQLLMSYDMRGSDCT
jgi:hypothetical protein